MNYLLKITALAFAYCLASLLAIALSAPPAYAPPAWPAAGIAMAAVLAGGYRMLPGVWLGAYAGTLAIVLTYNNLSDLSAQRLLLPGLIAMGQMMQAALGAWLVRRFVGFPNAFEDLRSVLRAALLAGPVACLLDPVWTSSMLLMAGAVSTDAVLINGTTWYAGNLLGILLGAPITLVWLARPRAKWRHRRNVVTAALLLICTGVAAVYMLVTELETNGVRRNIDTRAARIAEEVQDSLGAHIAVVMVTGSLMESGRDVSEQAYRRFVSQAFALRRGFRAILWAPADAGADPGVVRPRYSLYREKVTPLPADYAVSDSLSTELDAARDSGFLVISRRNLRAGGSEPAFVTVTQPVYAGDTTPSSREERRARLQGFVIGELDIAGVVAAAARDFNLHGLMLSVSAGEPGIDHVYVDRYGDLEHPVQLAPDFGWQDSFSVLNSQWAVGVTPSRLFVLREHSWRTWAVLTGAFLFAGLLVLFTLVVTGRTGEVERIVEQRTAELSAVNDSLEVEVRERRRTAAVLERKTQELERSNEDLERFAYSASHDLRSPLRSIDQLVLMLKEDLGEELPGDSQRYMDLIVGRVRRLDKLMEDLLVYAKASQAFEQLMPVDIGDMLDRLVESLDGDRPVTFTRQTRLPVLETEPAVLEQIFRQLLTNAVKHHDREEVNITLSCTEHRDFVEFVIADDGPGIESRYRERVFELFQTLRPRDRVEGSGMGLPIVKSLVERRGGRVWIDSPDAERGTSMHFLWPRQWTAITKVRPVEAA